MNGDRVFVGQITTCHGVKGELKVKVLTDFPERFAPGSKLFVGKEDGSCIKEVTVTSVRNHKGHLLVLLEGVADRNQAALLRGMFFMIRKDEVKQLPEDRFYIFDLEGLRVEDPCGNYLGRLETVLQTPANDIYVVKHESEELFVPALKIFVKKIDLEQGVMIVDRESLRFED